MAPVIVCAGIGLSCLGALAARQLEQRSIRSSFELGAERRSRAIRREIEGGLSALNSLRAFMEVPRSFTVEEFNRFSKRLLESHASLLSVEWVSRVRGPAARRSFEQEMSANGAPISLLTEGRPGAGTVAAERPEYFAVRFLYPLTETNRRAVGYDLGSCASCRTAIAHAASTGQAATMAPLRTLEREGYGVAVILPAAPQPAESGPSTYALMLLDVSTVVETALQSLDPQGIDIRVYDQDGGAAEKLLYAHYSRMRSSHDNGPPSPSDPVGRYSHVSSIPIGDHAWKLVFQAAPAGAVAATTWWPWIVLGGGLLGTVVVAGYAHSKMSHAEESSRYLHDLTERTQRLAEHEEHLRQILATAPDAIITLDAAGVITGWNPRAEAIFGWSAAEASGTTLAERIFPPPHRAAYESSLGSHLQPGNTVPPIGPVELTAVCRDGSERSVEATTVAVRIGGALHYSSFIRDISERKRLEMQLRQAQKMESLGQLAGGVAHDFNNLLTVINGYTELLLQSAGNTPQREYLDEVRSAGERATKLTHQLLCFSRKQTVQPTVLDLNATLASVHRMLERLLGEGIQIVTRRGPSLLPILADAGQIEQAIINMAINARDAMPRGGILTFETANVTCDPALVQGPPHARPGQYVRLTVSDTGVGMTPEVKARLFEPFFTTKEAGKGTGLGLATVHGIVTLFGGWISVTSERDVGSTFAIYLPPSEARPSESPRTEAPRHTGSETILVVEDQVEVRSLITNALQTLGYRVLDAASGEEAVAMCSTRSGRIDLVITDIVMPGMNGRELGEVLEQTRPQTRVLYMSGYVDNVFGPDGDIGCELDFLQKPFTPSSLAVKVREILDRDGR